MLVDVLLESGSFPDIQKRFTDELRNLGFEGCKYTWRGDTIVVMDSPEQNREAHAISLFGPGGHEGTMVLAPAGEADVSRVRFAAAKALAAEFHALYRAFAQDEFANWPTADLTDREKESLFWVARGKSTWEIARILGLSEKTVAFHIDNARRRLDVGSRIEAVLEAIRKGILPLDG